MEEQLIPIPTTPPPVADDGDVELRSLTSMEQSLDRELHTAPMRSAQGDLQQVFATSNTLVNVQQPESQLQYLQHMEQQQMQCRQMLEWQRSQSEPHFVSIVAS